MEITISELENRFLESLKTFRESASFSKKEQKKKLISQVDKLIREPEGFRFIYDNITELVEARIFEDTVWHNPTHLVPGLVGGTLLAGYPTNTIEVLSELRILAISEGKLHDEDFSSKEASNFLKDILVANFENVFDPFTDNIWDSYGKGELKKVRNLYDFLLEHIPLDSLKSRLAEEIETISALRPIVTTSIKRAIVHIDQRLKLDKAVAVDQRLLKFVDAFLKPTSNVRKAGDLKVYKLLLEDNDKSVLEAECREMSKQMLDTGIVSDYHVVLLQHVTNQYPDLIPDCLSLDGHGRADYSRHEDFLIEFIKEFIVFGNKQAIYGLAKVLQRNLFSRKVTWHAFSRLTKIKIHPEIAQKLEKGSNSIHPVSPIQLLIGGILCVLGQTLGVRQGNNPTCQSARGISMWSRHAPGKLINLLIDAATTNNLILRYEGHLVESQKVGEGLATRFDYKLDPVSIVLVPHLDRIYNEMMKKAAFKYPGKDPHISVNPSFYGHWIQTGFLSVYNPLTAVIDEFTNFTKVFYASFHPEYNGGHNLIYPVPIGIFITNSQGEMLGYHAISLLRITKSSEGKWRAYFFNPNSVGVQNWGQGIHPSVSGNGEIPGESSLPVHEFASRVYAFHYNHLRLLDRPEKVPAEVVEKVEELARNSWGRKYIWINN